MSLKNSKAKGSRNERKTTRLLESAGYLCIKAGASLGVFEVIGISHSDFIAVQVKSN
jgi:Holliday junction resolvase